MNDEEEFEEHVAAEKTVGVMMPLVLLSIVLGVILVAQVF